MSVAGWAEGAAWEPHGSEIVTAAALGAATIEVEWAGEFDDEGGTVDINGVQYEYGEGDIVEGLNEDDPDLITLTPPLVAPVEPGDRVLAVSGDQILSELTVSVSHGDGPPAEVVVPWDQRDLWPEGEYDPPIQVLLSNDLERIVDVPGRTPSRDTAFSYNPIAMLHKVSDSTLGVDIWTNISGLAVANQSDRVDITYEGSGIFRINTDGLYDFRAGATFVGGGTDGKRGLRVGYGTLAGDIDSREVKVPADGVIGVEINTTRRMVAGESVWFQAWQNSIAAIVVAGLSGSQVRTDIMIRRAAP